MLCAFASGCDTPGPARDGVLITGTAVLATTGEPISGLGVVLRNRGGVGSAIVVAARTETLADGSFRLDLPDPIRDYFIFRINDDPYNGCYSSWSRSVGSSTQLDLGHIELEDRPPNQVCNR
jgi:hypothetical protein